VFWAMPDFSVHRFIQPKGGKGTSLWIGLGRTKRACLAHPLQAVLFFRSAGDQMGTSV
jgi:hypothetical protein